MKISKSMKSMLMGDASMLLKRGVWVLCIFSAALLTSCNADVNSKRAALPLYEDAELMESADIKSVWATYHFDSIEVMRDADALGDLLLDFIIRMDSESPADVRVSVRNALDAVADKPELYAFFVDKLSYYLYDPNLATRSDLYYSYVLEYLIDSPLTDEVDRAHYETLFGLVNKNLPGRVATNFEFVSVSGEKETLHEQPGALKLLMFYDPNCAACNLSINDMRMEPLLRSKVADGALSITAICAVGDFEDWQRYQAEIPSEWVNGYNPDEDIIRNGLYDLKAFPTLFLLDSENKVLLKDVDMDQVLNRIGV